MIIFKDWTLSGPMEVIARQYDNLSRVLLVTGDLPGGYSLRYRFFAYPMLLYQSSLIPQLRCRVSAPDIFGAGPLD